ncbi:MAG: patatin-like phospholipase family protein [Pseudomonadota bacterium]
MLVFWHLLSWRSRKVWSHRERERAYKIEKSCRNACSNAVGGEHPMPKRIPVNLALQGGGSHGAFTWGVLDRLVEEDWLEVAAVSGTSAGAMNALALVQGLAEDGGDRVKALLAEYWRRVSIGSVFSPVQRTPFDRFFQGWRLDRSPWYQWMEMCSQFVSPYDINPLNVNALKDIVEDMFDFEMVNSEGAPRLYQSATNVKSGELKLFKQPGISAQTTLASACLPNVFRAVEIDGEAYWDGGYMGNPPLSPFIRDRTALDTILVQINPFRREEIPRRSYDISNRINEITFNSGLIRELAAAGLMHDLLEDKSDKVVELKSGRLHRIAAEETMKDLNVSSKMNAAPDFMRFLFETGRAAAEAWAIENKAKVGVETSWHPMIMTHVD